MKYKFIYFGLFCFLVVSNAIHAQTYTTKRIDELLINLQNLGDSLPLTVISKGQESYDASDEIDYDKGVVLSALFIAKALYATHQYDKVLEQNFKIEERALRIDDYESLSEIYRLNGISFSALGLFDQAAIEFQKSLGFTNLISDSDTALKQKGLVYKDLAMTCHKSGKKLEKVLEYFILSYNYFDKIKDSKTRTVNLSLANVNMGYCLLEMKKYNPASTYLTKAFNLVEQENYTTARLYTYLNLGRINIEQNQLNDGIIYLEAAIVLSKKLQKHEILGDSYLNLFKTYKKLGDWPKEEYYYDKYLFLTDSLQKVQKTAAIKVIKGVLDKKESTDIKIKQKWLIGLLVMAVFTFVIIYRAMRIYLSKIKERDRIAKKKVVLNEKEQFINKAMELDDANLIALVALAKTDDIQFMTAFKMGHADFYYRFLEKFPDLNEGELKVCAFLRLGFSVKDIAIYTNTTVRSVESRIYRIRRKTSLSIKKDVSLWILDF